jgi:hypothetical protein
VRLAIHPKYGVACLVDQVKIARMWIDIEAGRSVERNLIGRQRCGKRLFFDYGHNLPRSYFGP